MIVKCQFTLVIAYALPLLSFRDKSLPALEDLEDVDPVLAEIINERIEAELKNGPSLAQSSSQTVEECQPPKTSGHRQTARVLLSQLGLLSSQSLQVEKLTWGDKPANHLTYFLDIVSGFTYFLTLTTISNFCIVLIYSKNNCFNLFKE